MTSGKPPADDEAPRQGFTPPQLRRGWRRHQWMLWDPQVRLLAVCAVVAVTSAVATVLFGVDGLLITLSCWAIFISLWTWRRSRP